MEWLASQDPRIVQGTLSLLTALIPSGTALYIAVFVYSRQKGLDARIRLAEEIRKTCAELAELCSSVIDEPARLRESETGLQSVAARLARANYYENLLIMQRAPTPLVVAAQELSRSYGRCLKSLFEAFARGEKSDPEFEGLAKTLFEMRAAFVVTARDFTAPDR
jgi:hypothetical protein